MSRHTCPSGHAVPEASLFCVACGLRTARVAVEDGQVVVRPVAEGAAPIAFALVARGQQLVALDDEDLSPREGVRLSGHRRAKLHFGELLVADRNDTEWVEVPVEDES